MTFHYLGAIECIHTSSSLPNSFINVELGPKISQSHQTCFTPLSIHCQWSFIPKISCFPLLLKTLSLGSTTILLWYANSVNLVELQKATTNMKNHYFVSTFISTKLLINRTEAGEPQCHIRAAFSVPPCSEGELHLPRSEGEEADCYIQLCFLHRTGLLQLHVR